MKKLIIIFSSFIAIIVMIAVVLWFNMPSYISRYLTKEFGVETIISNVNINTKNLNIYNLKMQNPKGSKLQNAFTCKKINFNSTIKNIRASTFTIDSISLDNMTISVELYNKSGSDNNWARIMATKETDPKTDRKYLIKTLNLNNINIVLYRNNKIENLKPIKNLTFNNITNESGFPIEEIEKAIAHVILKHIFKQYNLSDLLKNIDPVNIIKKSLPIPFFK
jgi:hypothetical protein